MGSAVHDCVGALLVRDGRVLLGRRTRTRDWLADAWDVIGGHIEPGESPLAALRREVEEEVGVVPLHPDPLGSLGGEHPQSWRLRLYRVVAWEGEIHNRQPHEHAEIRWCALAEARALLAPVHPEFPVLLAAALR